MILGDIEVQEKLSELGKNIRDYKLSDAIKIAVKLGESYCREMEVARKESLKYQEEERHLVAPRYSTKEGKKWSEFVRDLGEKLFTDKAHPFYENLEELERNEFSTVSIGGIVQILDDVPEKDIAAAVSKKTPSTLLEYQEFSAKRVKQSDQTYKGAEVNV